VTHSCAPPPVWSRLVILNFNLHIAHHASPTLPVARNPTRDSILRRRAWRVPDGRVPDDEWRWSWVNRKRPLLDLMAPFFEAGRRPIGAVVRPTAGANSPLKKAMRNIMRIGPRVRAADAAGIHLARTRKRRRRP
jgi:hypothetical protein